jgi:hypothetical protein
MMCVLIDYLSKVFRKELCSKYKKEIRCCSVFLLVETLHVSQYFEMRNITYRMQYYDGASDQG